MWLVEPPAAPVADAKHINHIILDRKQDPIDMWFAAVK
jgi:hypothetical protein